MGAKLLIKQTLSHSLISHSYKRLCQEVTGPFQVNTGTCWSPPFISVGRKRVGCLCILNTDPLFSWEGKRFFFPKDPSGKICTVWCWETIALSFFPRVTQQRVLEPWAGRGNDIYEQLFCWSSHKGGLEKPEECFCVHSQSAGQSWCLLMDAVIIINRAGSEGLIDLCIHGIVCLNLARNCEILGEGWIIFQTCEDIRMAIMCWSKVHIDPKLGQYPGKDAPGAEQRRG